MIVYAVVYVLLAALTIGVIQHARKIGEERRRRAFEGNRHEPRGDR
jgi:hypothetical protein